MSEKQKVFEFFPSFVGSKKQWIHTLNEFRGKPFVEPFCGSAILSANLAGTARLSDSDPYVAQILSRFDEQIVPELFTEEDYLRVRKNPDWWKYAFCLQAMSFSGVFRYSKNGYNVPIKKGLKAVKMRERYLRSLQKWKHLAPTIVNDSYLHTSFRSLRDAVVVLDPPYQGSKASYNHFEFDYEQYWDWVTAIRKLPKAIIIFDRERNLKLREIPSISSRKMRVNGKHKGDVEKMAIFDNGAWREEGQLLLNI